MYNNIKKLNYSIHQNYIIINDYNKDKRICLIINDYDYHHLKIQPFFDGEPLLYIIKLNKYKMYKNHIRKILELYNISWNFYKDSPSYDNILQKSHNYIVNTNKPYALLLRSTN